MATFINKTEISDVMIERPMSFSIKRKHFSVYPPSLGKIQLTARLIEAMGLNENSSLKDLVEKVEEFREYAVRIITYSTLKGDSCLDENVVYKRVTELKDMDNDDIASVLLYIISIDKTEKIKKEFGMDTEAKRMATVVKAKEEDKNTFSFGGKSVWGALIDTACERYGWTYQYVMWDISYANLKLLLADQVKTVMLTEKERKKYHLSNDSTVIRADDTSRLNEYIKTHSWK